MGRSTRVVFATANAGKTDVVGGWSYGYCGEPFDWGTHTRYFTIDRITCSGNP